MIVIKTIGIIIRNFKENNKEFIGTRLDLFKLFYDYDVNVIGIPINNDFKKLKNIVDNCDGIILSGGDNFVKQDYLLVDYLYKKNIPTLGICLGMQLMYRYLTNNLEINVENHSSDNLYVHYINIYSDSLLYKIIGKNKILVNSRHKTGFTSLTSYVSAISDDGIVEGIEDESKKFFVGVEWHPESIVDNNSKNLFEYFIKILN